MLVCENLLCAADLRSIETLFNSTSDLVRTLLLMELSNIKFICSRICINSAIYGTLAIVKKQLYNNQGGKLWRVSVR